MLALKVVTFKYNNFLAIIFRACLGLFLQRLVLDVIDKKKLAYSNLYFSLRLYSNKTSWFFEQQLAKEVEIRYEKSS
jgi:hypothetical protein